MVQHDPRDFTNIIKVDNHVHLAAAMTARHLLHFIKKKIAQESDVCSSSSPAHSLANHYSR